jgi:hypothetical protein
MEYSNLTGPVSENQQTRQPARLSIHCTTARTINAFRPSSALVAMLPRVLEYNFRVSWML